MEYVSIISVPHDAFVYVADYEGLGEKIQELAPSATLRPRDIPLYGGTVCTVHATVAAEHRSVTQVSTARMGATIAIAAVFHRDLHITAKDKRFGRKLVDAARKLSELAMGEELRIDVTHGQIARPGASVIFVLPFRYRANVAVEHGRAEVISYQHKSDMSA